MNALFRSSSSFFRFLSVSPKHLSTLACSTDSTAIQNPQLLNFLINNLWFTHTQALAVCNRRTSHKTPHQPQSVINYFKTLGLSDSDIRFSAQFCPQIFFANVDKTLKPKVDFVLQLGLTGSNLCKLISKNPRFLACSLERKLKPRIEFFKKILVNDPNNHDLILVLLRCSIISFSYPDSRLNSNASYLQSCGIVGSQLALLLKRQIKLFTMRESVLRDLVSRVLKMGFSLNSRMLVHGVYTVSCMTTETFTRKLNLFTSFGFTKVELDQMFIRCPMLLRTSEDKLKIGMEFYLNVAKFKRILLFVNRLV